MSISKSMHSSFTEFFERPSSETLRPLLKLGVGETNNIDYKEQWPEKAKLAKHVLALANSGGGILIIGVKDGDVMESVGIDKVKDKTDVGRQLKPYIPDVLRYEVMDFNFSSSENSELKGKVFQVLFVESTPAHLPYLAIKAGDDLKNNAVYIRRDCSSSEAGYADLQRLFDSRISTQEAVKRLLDLNEHCDQLRLLFDQVPYRSTDVHSWTNILGSFVDPLGIRKARDLSSLISGAPKPETYQSFIKACIEKKKKRIEQELDI